MTKQEIYKTAAELRAQGRHPMDFSTGKLLEDLRAPNGKVIPAGARVKLSYLRRGAFEVTWEKSSRESVKVPHVSELLLKFRSHFV